MRYSWFYLLWIVSFWIQTSGILIDLGLSCPNGHFSVHPAATTEQFVLEWRGNGSQSFRCAIHLPANVRSVLTLESVVTQSNLSQSASYAQCMTRREKIVISGSIAQCVTGSQLTQCSALNQCDPDSFMGSHMTNVMLLDAEDRIDIHLFHKSSLRISLVPGCIWGDYVENDLCTESSDLMSCGDQMFNQSEYQIESQFWCDSMPQCGLDRISSYEVYMDESYCLGNQLLLLVFGIQFVVLIILMITCSTCCFKRRAHTKHERYLLTYKLLVIFALFFAIFLGTALSMSKGENSEAQITLISLACATGVMTLAHVIVLVLLGRNITCCGLGQYLQGRRNSEIVARSTLHSPSPGRNPQFPGPTENRLPSTTNPFFGSETDLVLRQEGGMALTDSQRPPPYEEALKY